MNTTRPMRLWKAIARTVVSLSFTSSCVVAEPVEGSTQSTLETEKLRYSAIEAAKNGKLSEAKVNIALALRAAPTDRAVKDAEAAINALSAADAELINAERGQKASASEAAQKRKNAATTDRPNRLIPGDTTNQERARAMRAEADHIEAAGKSRLVEARAKRDAIRQQLVKNSGPATSGGNKTEEGSKPPEKKPLMTPGRAMTAAEQAQVDAQQKQAQEASEREIAEAGKVIEKWTKDEAIIPPLPDAATKPSYEETLEFINGKIQAKGQKLWFGKTTGKMILSSPFNVGVFDPAALNADLKIGKQQGFGGLVHFVRAECRNGKKLIEGHSRSNPKPSQVWGLTLDCRDEVDAERVATALRHLILMFGGKPEAF